MERSQMITDDLFIMFWHKLSGKGIFALPDKLQQNGLIIHTNAINYAVKHTVEISTNINGIIKSTNQFA